MRSFLRMRSIAVAATLAAVLFLPSRVAADPTMLAPANAFYFGTHGLVLKLDVAYDQANRVYLSTWCTMASVCLGQFLDVNGQLVGAMFPIASPAGYIRVAWGADGFAVAYTPTGSLSRHIRFLRYTAGGTPQYLTDPIQVAVLGTEIGTEMMSMAYVPSSNHYLITWFEARGGLPQAYVAAYRATGAQTVARTHITDNTDGQHSPDIACDFSQDRCLVAGRSWGIPFGGTGGTWARFITASTGQPIGSGVTWVGGGALIEDAQVAYSPASGHYLVAWSHSRVAILARRLQQNMQMGPAAYQLVGADDRTYPDDQYGQVSLRYNTGSDTFLVAWKNNEGRPWMKALNSVGTPTTGRLAASSLTLSREDVWPTLAANHELKQFGLVHSQRFTYGQAVIIQADGAGTTAPPPPPPPPPPPTPPPPPPSTSVLSAAERARADFNGDGSSDLVWQNGAAGNLALWRMSGEVLLAGNSLSPSIVPDTRWKIVASGDFNKDGRPDLLWQHDTGYVSVWFMNAERQLSGTLLTSSPVSDPGWRIAAAGDIDGDGSADILWQHTDGRVSAWYMDGPRYRSGDVLFSMADAQWRLVGATDLNGDGRVDFVWHHAGTGNVGVWFMRGLTRLSGDLVNSTPPSLDWRLSAIVDLDKDGRPDFIWQNVANGDLAAWMMNGAALRHGLVLSPTRVADTNWRIVGPR